MHEMMPKLKKQSLLLAVGLTLFGIYNLQRENFAIKSVTTVSWGKTDDEVTTQDEQKKSQIDGDNPLDKYQNAENFYEYYYDRLDKLVNQSSLMWWRFSWKHFLEHFDVGEPGSFYYSTWDLCTFIREMEMQRKNATSYAANPKPHVLFARLNMDAGAVANVNKMYNGPKRRERNNHCTREDIKRYLNHTDTLAVFTTGAQDDDYGPKLISIPIGVKGQEVYRESVLKELQSIQQLRQENEGHLAHKRKNLLMINSKAWAGRQRKLDELIRKFKRYNYSLENTYGYPGKSYKGKDELMELYFDEMKQSKFIMSPKGLGIDCYRHWDALYVGTIPVIEDFGRVGRDGWYDRTWANLPVVFISNYSDLTPAYLESKYDSIVKHPESYNFEKLTKQYWIDLARSFVEDYKKRHGQQPSMML